MLYFWTAILVKWTNLLSGSSGSNSNLFELVLKYPSLQKKALPFESKNTHTLMSNLHWFISKGRSKYFYIINELNLYFGSFGFVIIPSSVVFVFFGDYWVIYGVRGFFLFGDKWHASDRCWDWSDDSSRITKGSAGGFSFKLKSSLPVVMVVELPPCSSSLDFSLLGCIFSSLSLWSSERRDFWKLS